MRILGYRALLTALLASACTRGQPPATTLPSPVEGPSPGQPAVPQTTRIWSFRPQEPIARRYLSEERMIVELQTGSVSRRDSFTVATSFTVQVLPVGARTRVVGSIETVTFQPERPAEQSDSLAIFPFAFRGHVGSNGALVLDSAAGQPLTTFTNCGIAGLNRISSVQRVLMTLPSTVTAGQAWTDSSTVAACSGTVPVQLTTVRTYRVIGETRVASGSVLTVERTDRIRAAGEGAQGQHRLTLRAEGSGSAQMSLDPGTGLVLQVDGKQRTELAVGASGRVERFVQSVEERTRLN